MEQEKIKSGNKKKTLPPPGSEHCICGHSPELNEMREVLRGDQERGRAKLTKGPLSVFPIWPSLPYWICLGPEQEEAPPYSS